MLPSLRGTVKFIDNAALAQLGEVEALRRAAFLQWISTLEPPVFTGVGELDSAATDSVIDLLDNMCRDGNVDSQLYWMLPYYAVIAEWWFDSARAPELAKFCSRHRPAGSVLPPQDFAYEDRRQLGAYWASIGRR